MSLAAPAGGLLGTRTPAGHSVGVGLISMRERVRQFGGSFEVDSVIGHTIVSAIIPLDR